MMATDTIVAPASAAGEAAIALIRISGPAVPALAEAVSGSCPPARRACLRAYRSQSGEILDHLILVCYAEGASYTGEHLLELSPHGNPLLVRRILDDLVARGCRLAEPGEFTRRAFINGRLDLTQAEAVLQMIRARSDSALQAARRQLSGSVGNKINSLISNLLDITSRIEAYIDFPEEDLPPEDQQGPLQDLAGLAGEMEHLIATRPYASLLHDGVKCVILGEPNAGKSSLLNALTGEDRALVSSEPGTTRDYIEERIHIGPYLLRIIDTAGLHTAGSELEQEGINRALQQIDSADLLLVVLDSTRPLPFLPEPVRHQIRAANTVIVENKTDLAVEASFSTFAPDCPHVRISAARHQGLDALRSAIRGAIEAGLVVPDPSAVLLSARHAGALEAAREAVNGARSKLAAGLPAELAAADLHAARDAMGAITGRIDNEAMLDRLFQQFCIGK